MYADDDDPLLGVHVVQLHQLRHGLQAWTTPTAPEDQDHDVPAQTQQFERRLASPLDDFLQGRRRLPIQLGQLRRRQINHASVQLALIGLDPQLPTHALRLDAGRSLAHALQLIPAARQQELVPSPLRDEVHQQPLARVVQEGHGFRQRIAQSIEAPTG